MKEKTRNFPAKQNKIQTRQPPEACEKFLPLCREDMRLKGWDELDILLVSGDAYIDHPAFAAALLGRYLEHYGFKVGIITQPDWKDPAIIEKIQAMGRPRLLPASAQVPWTACSPITQPFAKNAMMTPIPRTDNAEQDRIEP